MDMDILIVKTFGVVVMMLCASALAARRNHSFETRYEFWGLFIAGLALVFIIPVTKMPINLGLALVLAFIMGAIIGPGIKGMMMNYVIRKKLEKQGYSKKALAAMTEEERDALMLPVLNDIESPEHHSVTKDWNNILGLALYGTGAMTLITALVVS
jgi:hypothetical protein